MWFTDYNGPPDSWSASKHGYNEGFKRSVALIRAQFRMSKHQAGEDHGDYWKEYTLQGSDVRIMVYRFRFSEMAKLDRTLTPVFRLNLKVEKKVTHQSYSQPSWSYDAPSSPPWWLNLLNDLVPDWGWVRDQMRQYRTRPRTRTTRTEALPSPRWDQIFDDELMVVFPANYPFVPPKFRIDSPRYRTAGPSHEHHLFNDGWMCILASADDWHYEEDVYRVEKEGSDTVISGLNASLDWIVKHFNDFGW